jgi:oxygen-dependent protoporphyrinogen oxidase
LKIAVLGGGAAGLAAGLALRDRGDEVVVLEAAPRAGGKLGSLRKDGFLLESAAIGLLDRHGDLAPLCDRLGLQLLAARPGARYVQRKGVVRRFGPRVFSARELLGATRLPFTQRAARPGETVLGYFQRRAGAAGAFVADAIQTGVYAGDPAQLEMASAFPSLGRRAVAKLSSFAGGLQELIDALAREMGPSLRLNAPVRAVQAGPAAGFTLSLDDGELHADRLICALPAPATAALFPALAPHLRALRAAPLALVHFDLPGPGPQSFGLLAPGEPVPGLLFPSALWPGRAPPLPDDALFALARDHLARTLHLEAAAPLHITRWAEAIPQPLPGHAARISALERALPPGVLLAGAWYRGVSVLDCLRQGRHAAASIHAS